MRTAMTNVICLLITTVAVYLSQACTNRRTFVATEGKILSGHVISTHQVNSFRDCHTLCLEHPRCLSHNYQSSTTSSSHMCEINDATGKMCPRDMIKKTGFKYYEDYDASCDRICPRSDANKTTDFMLSFPYKSEEDYVRLDVQSCAAPLTAFTVCLWSKSSDQSDYGSIFSYSLPNEDNEILITDYSSLSVLLNSDRRDIEVSVNDDQWHHICITWENAAGSWNFYIDGTLVKSDDNFETGHVINNNGIFILGQDQDGYGSGFDQEQSFFGEMYGVNMWNRVLTAGEISEMSKNCSNGVGNYMRWSDFATGLHGDVAIKSPVTCKP